MNTSAAWGRPFQGTIRMTPSELRKIAFGGKAGALADAKGGPNAVAMQKVATRARSTHAGFRRPSVFIGMAIGLTLFLVGNRNAVVGLWTPSANVFAFIGAPVNLRGLEITNLRSVLVEEDGLRALMVEGDIKNIGGSSLKVPELDMNIRGSAARTLYSWRAPSPRSTLGKGEIMTFRTRLSAPPDGATEVHVRFSTT